MPDLPRLATRKLGSSECAALAVFLDRIFAGEELVKDFGGAKMRIVPSARGKKSKMT